ncbi:MAG: hypothetical protein AAF416_17185 [Pseudomonadota bacterium]
MTSPKTDIVFVEDYQFWWDVIARVPVDSTFVEQPFEARFKLATDEALFPEHEGEPTIAQMIEHEVATLRRHIVSLRGIVAGDGASGQALIEKLLATPPYRKALSAALLEAHTGGKARAGN